jgi:hypothetical protein
MSKKCKKIPLKGKGKKKEKKACANIQTQVHVI